MTKPRLAYYIDQTMHDKSGAWVPAIVEEDDFGYTPVSYRWPGITFEQAKAHVAGMNTDLGLTTEDVLTIVASSFAAQS